MIIPIVIAAFNRDHTLVRLLSSLAKGKYQNPVKLIISIDGGGPDSVKSIANDFTWEFGPKQVIEQPENLGLRRHILACGHLATEYDGIILLEDDLYVSPWFYDYALAALEFYRNCTSICGISLYSYRFNETSLLPFIPLNDASHAYFMQVPCSWGQAWLKEHWSAFESWYSTNLENEYNDDPTLPANIVYWPATSWKKYFVKYMVEHDKYFVYPTCSYATNFGDKGQHHTGSNLFQVPIQLGRIENYIFNSFEASWAKYDACSELRPECLNALAGGLINEEFSVDLHGTKRIESLTGEYVLTTKKCRSYISSFGRYMLPVEMNVINQISGNDIYLTRVDQIEDYGSIHEFIFERATNIQNQQYYLNTDTFHYSLLHRAENKINVLYQEVQLLQASLTWRLTAPIRKFMALFAKKPRHKNV